jgi:hypothetical protein
MNKAPDPADPAPASDSVGQIEPAPPDGEQIGQMSTIIIPLNPHEAILRSSAYPYLGQVNGTNIPVFYLSYDRDQSAFWQIRVPGYTTGNLSLTIDWYADTATSGNVVFGGSIAAITPNSDTQDIETDSLATETSTTTTHLGTIGQRVHRTTVTISNLDSVAADDFVWIRIRRGSGGDGDTATGRVHVVKAAVSYTDGAADAWTYIKLGTDATTTSATAVSVSGLAFTPAASRNYEFKALLLLRTATATVGPRPGITWPTGMTDGVVTARASNSATAEAQAHGNKNAAVVAASTGIANNTQSYPGRIDGYLIAGASPSGNLQVTIQSETGGTTVTVKAGSFLAYREV